MDFQRDFGSALRHFTIHFTGITGRFGSAQDAKWPGLSIPFFVVLMLFGGWRWLEDVESYVESYAAAMSLLRSPQSQKKSLINWNQIWKFDLLQEYLSRVV